MEQIKNTTVRFGFTEFKDFAETDETGDWQRFANITFSTPFGLPVPGLPKGVPQEISVVATAFDSRVAAVPVIKNVTSTGFVLWARNAFNKRGPARFAWLAVLGVPESHEERQIDARLGIMQTKVLEPTYQPTEWPGIWYSEPMVSADPNVPPAVLMTANNLSGPARSSIAWNNPAAVGWSIPQRSGPVPVAPGEGFTGVGVNVDPDEGRCGYYFASFVDSNRFTPTNTKELWLDHGSDKGVEDGFRYNASTWPTAPGRRMKPRGTSGDWAHLDVYFDKPFATPPIVLATARDTRGDPDRTFNPLVVIAQNVTTHGFTMALRNTGSDNAMAEFYWIAIGCQRGCA